MGELPDFAGFREEKSEELNKNVLSEQEISDSTLEDCFCASSCTCHCHILVAKASAHALLEDGIWKKLWQCVISAVAVHHSADVSVYVLDSVWNLAGTPVWTQGHDTHGVQSQLQGSPSFIARDLYQSPALQYSRSHSFRVCFGVLRSWHSTCCRGVDTPGGMRQVVRPAC